MKMGACLSRDNANRCIACVPRHNVGNQGIWFDKLCDAQWELGNRVRDILKAKGIQSVAADGFGAPGVVVSYTGDPSIQNGSKFAAEGMQIAAGVPWPVMNQKVHDIPFGSIRVGQTL